MIIFFKRKNKMATTIKDPSLSLGGQFATTGETKEEYDRMHEEVLRNL